MDERWVSMENHGIRLKRFNTLLISISLIFSVFLTYAAVRTINSYREMRTDTERYIESERQASDLQSGSDYLTEQARNFVVTGDPAAVARYFEEVKVTRRRDTALEALGEYVAGTESFRLLSSFCGCFNSCRSFLCNLCLYFCLSFIGDLHQLFSNNIRFFSNCFFKYSLCFFRQNFSRHTGSLSSLELLLSDCCFCLLSAGLSCCGLFFRLLCSCLLCSSFLRGCLLRRLLLRSLFRSLSNF